MFSKQTYISRRMELKKLVKSGIIILFGNNESPANYPANAYYPFRQDSSCLYYFRQFAMMHSVQNVRFTSCLLTVPTSKYRYLTCSVFTQAGKKKAHRWSLLRL